jgi:dimethylaniline monooxygenase (N-oxide forming)
MALRVIVIGAGWSGLAAAKTYLQIDPAIDLTILDDDSTVGGVWSSARLYPGLIANSPNGLYEYSDLSMVTESQPALKPVPGKQVQAYLHQYAEKNGLLSRIRFGSNVVKAERRGGGGWTVRTSGGDVLECDKLLVATGLYSKPHWPNIPRDGDFTGTVIHSKSLGQEHCTLSTEKVADVVIVGGCKSAVEAATIFLMAGKRVHWVIRESQQGVPLIVVDPDMRPNLLAVNNARLFNVWSPSIFATTGFWYGFIHTGRWYLGNFLYFCFWILLSTVVMFTAGYGQSENGRKIKPNVRNLFRVTSYASLVHTNNPFLGWLHSGKNIMVYRASPTRLVKGGMQLDSGQVLRADAVVYATGWRSSIDFFDEEEVAQLGIPMPLDQQDVDAEKLWDSLDTKGDMLVTDALPRLAEWSKPEMDRATGTTQFRMYRQVLSPRLLAERDRSITFVGFISNSQTSICSEILALWAVAWMEDILPKSLPAEAQMEVDVARVNAWMARRYGARGRRDPEIVLEIQTFFDQLMQDLGLRVHRKNKGFFGPLVEWVVPYEGSDYKGMIDEFLALVKPTSKIA